MGVEDGGACRSVLPRAIPPEHSTASVMRWFEDSLAT